MNSSSGSASSENASSSYRRRRSAQQEAALQVVNTPGGSVNANQSTASRRPSAHSNLQHDLSFTLTSLSENNVTAAAAGISLTRPTTPTMTANSPLVSLFSKQRAADEVQAVASMLASGDIQRPASAPPRSSRARSHLSLKDKQLEDDMGVDMMESAQASSPPHDSPRSIRVTTLSIKETALDTMHLFTLKLSDRSLALLFFFIVMWGAVLSLDRLTTYSYQTIATNSFASHSSLALVNVVRAVVAAIAAIPFAVIADLGGRYQAFTFAMTLYTAGHIVMALSKDVPMYIGGVVLYETGANALVCLQNTVLADMTSSRNRLFFQMVPQMPFLVFSFISSDIYSAILPHWRWGIALFAIMGPASLLPVVWILHSSQKGHTSTIVASTQASRLRNTNQQRVSTTLESFRLVQHVWMIADITGLFLLASSLALILIPLTLASSSPHRWENPKVLGMISTGVALAVIFGFWEIKRASNPILGKMLLKNATFWAGGITVCLLWTAHATMLAYFPTYLYVVHNTSNRAQQNISVIYSFTIAASALPVALVIRYTRRFKIFTLIGVVILTAGLSLMVALHGSTDSIFHLVASQVVIGLGGALTIALLQMAVQVSVPHAFVAQSIATFNVFPCIGNAIGAAVAGAMWSGLLPGHLIQDLASSGHQNDVTNIYAEPLTWIESYPIGTAARTGVIQAYSSVWRIMMITATIICASSLLSAICLPNLKLNDFLSAVEDTDKKQDGRGENNNDGNRRLFGDRLFERIEDVIFSWFGSKQRLRTTSFKVSPPPVNISQKDSKDSDLFKSYGGSADASTSHNDAFYINDDGNDAPLLNLMPALRPAPIVIVDRVMDGASIPSSASPGPYSPSSSPSAPATVYRAPHSVQRPSPLAHHFDDDVHM